MAGERRFPLRLNRDILRKAVEGLRAEQRDQFRTRTARADRFAEGVRGGSEEVRRARVLVHCPVPPYAGYANGEAPR